MRTQVYLNPLAILRTGALISLLLALSTVWAVPGESRIAVGPVVTFDPDSLDFGNQVAKRTSKEKRILVKNIGDGPLTIDSVDIRGDNPNSFSILRDSCTGATVEANRACFVDVTFTPSGTGSRNARVRIDDNALDSPQRVPLKGNGINAIDVEPFPTSQ